MYGDCQRIVTVDVMFVTLLLLLLLLLLDQPVPVQSSFSPVLEESV